MGVYKYDDPTTGIGYDLNIAGGVPTDAEFAKLAAVLERDRADFITRYEDAFGEPPKEVDDGTAISRGFARGKKQVKGAVGETIGTIGERSGLEFLENYGEGLEERAQQELGELSLEQPKRLQSTDVDSVGSALQYAGEVVGEQIPQLGIGLGAAVVGTAAAPLVAPVLGAAAPFVAGATVAGAATAPILFGNNIQRQEDEVAAGKKASVDVGAALKATFGQAVLEGVADKILLGGAFRSLGKSIFTRTASRVGSGATTEGLTEVGQQMMERSQAGLPIDSDDAIAEYREAAIAGGLIGGGTRATFGAIGEGDPDTETGGTTRGQGTNVAQGTQTAPQLQKDQAQGELFAEPDITAAQEKDARNEADPKPEKSKAEKTEEEIAEDSAVAGAATNNVTSKNALDSEEQNVVNKAAREQEKADAKSTAKTNEYLKDKPKEDRAAALESEQTGQQIEVGKEPVQGELFAEEVFTPDYVKNVLGITRATAPLLKAATKGDLSGRSLDDPEIVDRLSKYVNRRGAESETVKAVMKGRGYDYANFPGTDSIGFIKPRSDIDAGGDSTTTGGARASVQSSGSGVAGTGRAGSRDPSTEDSASSDTEGVGTDRGDTVPPVVAAREQPDTLRRTALPLGQETAADAQLGPIPEGIPPVPRTETTQEAAPEVDVQAQQELNVAAQQALNDRFVLEPANNKEGRDTAVARQYYEEQQLESQEPDSTNADDKQAILNLFSTQKNQLTEEAKAAKIFFDRFRRPIDALEEIGGMEVVGPTQYTKKLYSSDELAFYTGMTKSKALAARKWAQLNLSEEASSRIALAAQRARKDTSKFNPSDKEIEAGRAAKKEAKNFRDAQSLAYKRQVDEVVKQNNLVASIPAQIEAMPEQKQIIPDLEVAFKKYLRDPQGLNFTQAEIDTMTPAQIQEYRDGYNYSYQLGLYLDADAVHGLDIALLPSVRSALMNGNLRGALDAIAVTNQIDSIREIAAKLGAVVGDTQVRVVDNLSQVTGRNTAGMFEPETNTISIDANNGMNVHTILHEMTHAATSASIAANPSLPEVKQLQTILKNIREQFGEIYGTASLDEFVAEAFSNPEFQSALALTRVDGGKMLGWEKFTGAIKRIFRRLGLSPSPTALSEVNRIIDGMLSPSPATRAAPSMLMLAGTKTGAKNLARGAASVVPEGIRNSVADSADVMFNEGASRTLRSWFLNTLPVNILTDKAKKFIPFARELNTIINTMSGSLRKKSEMLDSILFNLHKWQRKNKDKAKILNNLIPRSTYLQVDPSRTDIEYMKDIRNDKERSAEYDQLRAEYNKLKPEGQAFYRQMRNYFQDTYKEIMEALDIRLNATIPNLEQRKSAMAKIQDMMQKQSGTITPYFPLMRKGAYRLSYTAPDPQNSNPNQTGERFVEYYPTERKATQALQAAENAGASDLSITSASKRFEYENNPSPGFVGELFDTLNEKNVSKEAMSEVIDLVLDAMPERSFLQGFRKRGNVRGFIGDTTPTGIGGTEFDAYTMMKEKGRDLNRQLVQMKASAELVGFKNKLTSGKYDQDPRTAMMAGKLAQIATFAQSPDINRTSQIVNSLGFGYTMGLNFSSAAITFFDVAMSAMPVLAGKHGIRATSKAFGTASKLFMGAPKTRTVMVTGADGQLVEQEVNMGMFGKSGANYDLNSLPSVLQENRGDILLTMGTDQGQFNQSMTQENLEMGRGAPLETFNKFSSFMFHHSERFNRETTLVAAYLLEVQKLKREKGDLTEADYRDAAQEAIDSTEFTLGATASAGRPIIAQNAVGNVAFLFKRFAISKYYMMAKLAKESAGTTNINKIMADMDVSREEAQAIASDRKVARAAGRNFLVSTGIFAGLGGMPMMGAIGVLYNMFADEDEDDFEAATRKFVGEGIYGGLANEMLGVDLANRISMNSLLYRAPIIDKDQSNLWTLIEQLGGPVIGVGLSVERGMGDVYEGEWYRGVESMVPASVRNGMKSFRFATEGATTRRGDAITEDINPYNVAMQLAGFAPQAYIQRLEINKNERRKQTSLDSKRTKLLRKRNMAMREGDYEEVQKVDELISEFNASIPEAFVRDELITIEAKERSFKAFLQMSRKMRGGVSFTDGMLESLEEYDLE